MISTSNRNISSNSPSDSLRQDSRGNAASGASAAGVRAISSQLVAFYFRAPVKAFFRTRVDYLAFARAINPQIQANQRWSWSRSSAGLLTHAVRSYGWGFIPNQVLPPLLANTSIGALLYTSYLQLLGRLHRPSAEAVKCGYPPPPPTKTFAAGCTAGAIQSVVAAPLDALNTRFRPADILDGKYQNMWQYGYLKTAEIGVRGILAGWGLSLIKDVLGYGLFFATFEYVKAQSYQAFVTRYYGGLHWWQTLEDSRVPVIKPHYAIEPSFLMVAGIAASVAQQVVHHPIGLVQDIHCRSLTVLDRKNRTKVPFYRTIFVYLGAYHKTLQQCRGRAARFGGWRRWLYRHFFWNTIRQVPSTSAGLVIFELMRRRYGVQSEAAQIE